MKNTKKPPHTMLDLLGAAPSGSPGVGGNPRHPSRPIPQTRPGQSFLPEPYPLPKKRRAK